MNIAYLNTETLTNLDVLRGKILTPENVKYLKAVYTEITLNLSQVDLNENAEVRIGNVIARAYEGGKVAFIEELLRDSENAQMEMALAMQQQNQR